MVSVYAPRYLVYGSICQGVAPSPFFVCLADQWVYNGTNSSTLIPTIFLNSSYYINGNLLLNNNVTITSANLIISGNLQIADSSYTDILPNSDNSPAINVTGCVSFGGTLQITLPSTYNLSLPFRLASYSCHDGTFSRLDVKFTTADAVNCREGVKGTIEYLPSETIVLFDIGDICSSAASLDLMALAWHLVLFLCLCAL